jgi:glycosyltransferase involved in cell wall biosynthesis
MQVSLEVGRRHGKMLVLTSRFPFPLLGGDAIRIYQLCCALQEDWDLTLVSLCQSREELAQPLPPDAPFRKVERVYLPKWKSYVQAGLALFTGGPLQVAYYRSAGFSRIVERIKADHDVLLCHLLRTAPYAAGFEGRKLLELTDHLPLTYRRAKALRGAQRGVLGFVYAIEAERIARAQRQLAPGFDLVSFVSDVDRRFFLEETAFPAEHTISFQVSVDLRQRPFAAERKGRKLAFIGNMRTLQNRDAVRHFVTEILPLVRLKADVSLKVVGSVDPAFAAEMTAQGSVEFVGVVPSVADALQDCAVGVCPVRVAAGIQNKVLDYMSLGLAAVATKEGAEGILGQNGKHLVVADGPHQFAGAVIQLLGDEARRKLLAENARSLVESEYSLEANMRRMRDRLLVPHPQV